MNTRIWIISNNNDTIVMHYDCLMGEARRCVCERRAGIEVLRNLSMFAIVLYHCQMFGLWAWQPQWWCEALHAPLMWHVPAFAAISGWFGIRFSVRKFFKIWTTIVFYCVIGLAYRYWVSGWLQLSDIRVNAGWYGGTYLGLMLVSPILNAAADSLCKKNLKDVLMPLLLVAAMFFFNWAPRHLFTGIEPGGVGGMTLIMLMFLYLTARIFAIKFDHIGVYLTKKRVLILLGIFFCFSIIRIWVKCFPLTMLYNNYDSILVWPMGVLLVVLFDRYLNVTGRIAAIACLLAPSMFGVYLMHVVSIGCGYVANMQEWIGSATQARPFVVVVMSSIIVFVCAVIIDIIRRTVFKGVGIIWKKCKNTIS